MVCGALFAQAGMKSFMAHNDATSSESGYLGAKITAIPDKVQLSDPTTYLSAHAALLHSQRSNDPIVPQQQHVDFAAAVKTAIGSENVNHVVLQGASHGGPQFETKAFHDGVSRSSTDI